MKKSDIKNGMHVITNEMKEYIIIGGIEAQGQIESKNTADIIMLRVDGSGWMPLDEYDDDLHYYDPEDYEDDTYYDIKVVYEPKYYAWALSSVFKNNNRFIKVWERSIPKKMTKAEIEAELGYEIKIVG